MLRHMRIDAELIRAVCDGECVLFVGSGLSSGLKNTFKNEHLPSWPRLLEAMLKYYISHVPGYHPDWKREVEELIRGKSDKDNQGNCEIKKDRKILVAAQELKDRLSHAGLLGQFLQEWFDSNYIEQPRPNHDRIARIGFRAFLTTNYDELIESGFTGLQLPSVFDKYSLNQVSIPLHPKGDPFIFRLHGIYSNPQAAVLGTRDYQDTMFGAPGYRQLIRTLFSVYTVLFVGFSGDDPHLESILDELSSFYNRQQPVHYLILPEEQMNSVARERLQQDRRVRVIEYPSTNHDHTMLSVMLDYLEWPGVCQVPHQNMFPQNGVKVYIGHSRDTDENLIIATANRLEQAEFVTWYALKSPSLRGPGEEITPEDAHGLEVDTAAAMSQADIILMLVDVWNLDDYPGVSYEMSYAHFWSQQKQQRNLIYIPAAVGDVPIPDHLSSPYETQITPDFEALMRVLNDARSDLFGARTNDSAF